ncbi:MAG: imidazoleglycerol-phosphate dehydratase HisB, partial [Oscillospiraceae bacterium]|nr:imidazoleglycerol-phosphate dehydratase HisB [Oscillospiraceae bacterium]
SRTTKETAISAEICLDGGVAAVETGIGFFDHMLTAFAVHGGFGLTLNAAGDLQVDSHHTVEDTGIVLGQAFADALSDKSNIARFGSFFVPMDEALGFATVDVSGRPYLFYDARLPEFDPGSLDRGFDVSLIPEFFRAFVVNAGITLHLRSEYGDNIHHILEALFKAAGHALRLAVTPKDGLLSTKGVID